MERKLLRGAVQKGAVGSGRRARRKISKDNFMMVSHTLHAN